MSIQAGQGSPAGPQPGETPRYCSTCGALLSEGAALCGECGARYRESPYERRATDAPGAWAAPPRRSEQAVPNSAPAAPADEIQLLGSSAPEPADPAGTAPRGPSQYDRGMDAQQPVGAWGQQPSAASGGPVGPDGAAPLAPPLDGCVPAGIGRRVLAFVIDGVLAGLTALPLWIGAFLLAFTQSHVTLGAVLCGLGAALPLAFALVIVWLQGSRGFTVGDLVMGLRVVREDTGAPLGFGRSLARYIVLGLLTWIAGLTTFLDPERHGRGLHDRMISAVLVDARAGRDPFAPRPDDFARPDASQYLGEPAVPVSVRENLVARPGAAWEEQGGADAAPAPAGPGSGPSQPPAPSGWASGPARSAEPDPAAGPYGSAQDPAPQDPAAGEPAAPETAPEQEPIITSSPWAPAQPPVPDPTPDAAPAPPPSPVPGPPGAQAAPAPNGPEDDIIDPWASAAAPGPVVEPAAAPSTARPSSAEDPSALWTSPPAPADEPAQPASSPAAEQSAPADEPAPPDAAPQPAHPASAPEPPQPVQAAPASEPPQPVQPVPSSEPLAAPAQAAPADLDESTRLTHPSEDLGDIEATRIVPARRDRRPGFRLLLDDGTSHEVRGSALLGRNPAAEEGAERIVVSDETRSVSKSHLRLEATAEGLEVVDLGSTNGSALILADGTSQDLDPHSPLSLPDGATLAIGDRTLTVERIQ